MVYVFSVCLLLPFVVVGLYDYFYGGKPRPRWLRILLLSDFRPQTLWVGLFLSVLGGFLGLWIMPALKLRAFHQFVAFMNLFSAWYVVQLVIAIDLIDFLWACALLDRLAALQAVLWLWREDPERYRMDAGALRAWTKAKDDARKAADN